jgi:hypothetical protein
MPQAAGSLRARGPTTEEPNAKRGRPPGRRMLCRQALQNLTRGEPDENAFHSMQRTARSLTLRK